MGKMSEKPRAPFPWFGGKRPIASLVWDRLGDVDNYIEPFAGSVAVLLCRPHPPRVETINDLDCYVANFWRSTAKAPEEVAEHADWPINEADLHARHRWLVQSEAAAEFRQRMRTDPDYYDPKVAGWWCWGMCCWIGGGWCAEPESPVNGPAGGSGERRPRTSHNHGVHRKTPAAARANGSQSGGEQRGVHGRPQLADAFSRGRGVHGNDAAEVCADRRAWLLDWFGRLRDRLRVVRVCCGDWHRVCSSDSTTIRLGVTGVFLDPPYGAASGRDPSLYSTDSLTVAGEVRKWCLERGNHPKMRIALCGYEGEGHEELESHGWKVEAWKTQGGYGNLSEKGSANAARERIWFSPHCNHQRGLFDGEMMT